jgi:hypothetical protein
VGLVGGWHDHVAIRVAIEHQFLLHLVPWHEVGGFLVDNCFSREFSAGCVDVEAHHAAHHVNAALFLPGFVRAR